MKRTTHNSLFQLDKIFRALASITLLIILAISILFSGNSVEAEKITSVSLVKVRSDSWLAEKLTESPGSYSYVEPLSDTQTRVTPEDTGRWYGWSLNPSVFKPCPNAIAQSVRVRAQNETLEEGNPDWSVMVLSSYNSTSQTVNPLTPNRPVIEGYSPDQSPIYVGRWSSDIFPNYPGTEEGMGTGIGGPMEAIWNVESLQAGEELVLGVGHDAEDLTVGLQTSIESVSITYNDSACSNSTSSGPASSPSSPKTGDAISMIASTAAATTAIFLILRAAKRLKAKH